MSVRLAFSVAIQVDADVLLDRRGARGRRRRVPAEVLRPVPPAQGRGQDDRLRHPRHERGRALLRPGDAARARADRADRRAARDRPRLQRAQLRPPRRTARRRTRAAATTRRPRSRRRGSRTPPASACQRRSPQGEPLRAVHARSASTHDDRATRWFSLPPAQRGAPHGLRHRQRRCTRPDTGAFAAGETVTVRVRLDNWFAPGPLHAHADGRAARRRPPTPRPARGPRRAARPRRRASFGGVVDVPHTLEVERA